MRAYKIIDNYQKDHPASVCVCFGHTYVICAASYEERVPSFLKDSGQGWVTAEYGMLPSCSPQRVRRDRGGSVNGRSIEIQRLIARSLRAGINLKGIPDLNITVDCDVIQADGGTRTAAITGGYVALAKLCMHLIRCNKIQSWPMKENIVAVSAGLVGGKRVIDLCYQQDFQADVDMNIVCTGRGGIVEIQGTSEGEQVLTQEHLIGLLEESKPVLGQLKKLQDEIIEPLKETL